MSGLGWRAGMRPPWPFGHKKVYLPSFRIILLRTPRLDPYQAKFEVPLNLGKLDVRDYLWNLYGVRALSVRSYVQQQPIRHDRSGSIKPSPRRWHRAKSKKFMTIEMDQPFRWPDPPEDMEDVYDMNTNSTMTYEQNEIMRRAEDGAYEPPPHRRSLAEQAKELLQGKEKWRPTWQELPQSNRPLPRE